MTFTYSSLRTRVVFVAGSGPTDGGAPVSLDTCGRPIWVRPGDRSVRRLDDLGEPPVRRRHHRTGERRVAVQRDAAGRKGRDPQGLFHAAGARPVDRLAAQADIGGQRDFLARHAGGLGLIAPGGALGLLELAAAGQPQGEQAERDEGEMDPSHEVQMRTVW